MTGASLMGRRGVRDKAREPSRPSADRKFELRLLVVAAAGTATVLVVGTLAYLARTGWVPLHRVDVGTANVLNSWTEAHPGAATFLVGVTMAGASFLGWALKEIVRRARPVVHDPVSSAPGFSFPSGPVEEGVEPEVAR
jgi:membrane-associated phospholipid phosphatase